MTYSEALAYIHSTDWRGSRPGLSRIRELCRRLGNPQSGMRFVHVAGTNGKGSFCRMLSGILAAAGYRVGLFTSPYVLRFNERMMINNREIPDADLARETEEVRPFADSMEELPSEFELISAVAFRYFKHQNCDLVVLECGMGGRLDSTNIIENPLLSVITGIDFDHTAYLGNTIEAIATEKGGIIKTGRPCLWGGENEAAQNTLAEIAKSNHAPFFTVDRTSLAVKAMTLDGTVFDFAGLQNLRLSLLGSYQPRNAAAVLSAVSILQNEGLSIPESAIRRGLEEAVWHARFERLRKVDPVILYDGGHNPQGVRAAVEAIETYFPGQKVNLLSGVMADKDCKTIVEALFPVAAKVFAVTPKNPRALGADEYAALFASNGVLATAFAEVPDALGAAVEDCRKNSRPLICLGSLYLYSELRAAAEAFSLLS